MSIEVTEQPATPTEVLIPEARRHQRVRHMRLGIILAITALLIALVGSAVVLLIASAGGKTQRDASTTALRAGTTSHVYFRPVLCTAPPYTGTGAVPSTSAPPMCSPASLLSTKNLNVEPGSATGFSTSNVVPDSALTSVPSTKASDDRPSATVLVPALSNACYAKGYRCVLGPAEMTTSSIRSATAKQTQIGEWVVDYTTTTPGGLLLDKVAEESFHTELAIEVNGLVYSAPIIQPTQTSFTSFDGKGEIGGAMTKAQATHLAGALNAHRM